MRRFKQCYNPKHYNVIEANVENSDRPPTSLKTISLFPLPNSVFYPGTVLPLHIFEERYRQMIGDAIDSGQWIGMVLLQPGYEEEYNGSPDINPVGCAGNLDHWTKHDDGKYDIVLRGQSRFRIVREVGDTLYRQAEVELLNSANDQTHRTFRRPVQAIDRKIPRLHQSTAARQRTESGNGCTGL